MSMIYYMRACVCVWIGGKQQVNIIVTTHAAKDLWCSSTVQLLSIYGQE